MGYGISIMKDGEVCRADENIPYQGSNICIGGTDRLSITVTYNYSDILCEALGGKGLNDLDGCNVKCTLSKLRDAIDKVSKMDEKPWIDARRRELEEYLERTEGDSDPYGLRAGTAQKLDDLDDGYVYRQDYWLQTPDHVRQALEGLLWMAEHAPDGSTWEVN